MGLELRLFLDKVEPDLICFICGKVFNDPVMLDKCEHFFCRECVAGGRILYCPIDNNLIEPSSIRKAFPFLNDILANLKMRCKFFPQCDVTIIQKFFNDHEASCLFNPLNNIICPKGCQIPLTIEARKTHDCVVYFKECISQLQTENKMLKIKIAKLEDIKNALLLDGNSINSSGYHLTPQFAQSKMKRFIHSIDSFEMPMPMKCHCENNWKDTPFLRLTLTLVEDSPNVKKILSGTDLSNFFFIQKYTDNFYLETFKKNSIFFLHVFLFDLLEPIVSNISKILILDYVDNGLSQWLAQKAHRVITAVHKPIINELRQASDTLPVGSKIHYIPLKIGLNRLCENIRLFRLQYDLIISYTNLTDSDVKHLFQEFAPDGKFLAFNHELYTLKFHTWEYDSKGIRHMGIQTLLNSDDLEPFVKSTIVDPSLLYL